MQSNLNYTFFILSTFAVANPGTLGTSLQSFFEALIQLKILILTYIIY